MANFTLSFRKHGIKAKAVFINTTYVVVRIVNIKAPMYIPICIMLAIFRLKCSIVEYIKMPKILEPIPTERK